jgi:hypothetical protein
MRFDRSRASKTLIDDRVAGRLLWWLKTRSDTPSESTIAAVNWRGFWSEGRGVPSIKRSTRSICNMADGNAGMATARMRTLNHAVVEDIRAWCAIATPPRHGASNNVAFPFSNDLDSTGRGSAIYHKAKENLNGIPSSSANREQSRAAAEQENNGHQCRGHAFDFAAAMQKSRAVDGHAGASNF